MDELKTLLDMMNGLPHLALWVAVGFWAYKVIVIGSIYGVIRYGLDTLRSVINKEAKLTYGGGMHEQQQINHSS